MCVCFKQKLEQSLYKVFFLMLMLPIFAQAEGSRDLYPEGAKGYRAYLLTPSTSANFNPFATPGTMKVYVKEGETVYVGSSTIGKNWKGSYGSIVLRTPNGTTYTVTGNTTDGAILNRTQELNGPIRPGVTNG